MFLEKSFSLADSPEAPLDRFTKMTSEEKILGSYGSASGGYLEYVMRCAARELFGVDVDVEKEKGVVVKIGRNKDFKEVVLEVRNNFCCMIALRYMSLILLILHLLFPR